MAIADKLESDTYGENEERMTNAIRMQTAFAQYPGSTWKALCEKLIPYKQRLMKRSPGAYRYYERLIREISDGFTADDPAYNRPPDERYVLCYNHQYSDFYKKQTPENAEEPTENK